MKVKVDLKSLEQKVKDKKNIYTLLVNEGNIQYDNIPLAQIYLPPFDDCKLEFIKELCGGEKKVLI